MFPKPPTRKTVKAKARRADAKMLKAFRDAVWEREGGDFYRNDGFAFCQQCHLVLFVNGVALRGEVHHRIGRRSKADRYNPDNGVLLCKSCHRKVTEHQIPCP